MPRLRNDACFYLNQSWRILKGVEFQSRQFPGLPVCRGSVAVAIDTDAIALESKTLDREQLGIRFADLNGDFDGDSMDLSNLTLNRHLSRKRKAETESVANREETTAFHDRTGVWERVKRADLNVLTK